MQHSEVPYTGPSLKAQLLHWAARHPYCVFLDSCDTDIDQFGRYDFLLGVAGVEATVWRDLKGLDAAMSTDPLGWRLGYFSYDLKNALEPKLETTHSAAISVPDLQFFQPEIVIAREKGSSWLSVLRGYREDLMAEIEATPVQAAGVTGFSGFTSNFEAEAYKATVDQLREHIRNGDCYEINLSQNFRAEVEIGAPAALWQELVRLSPVPFAGYARFGDMHLLCASPERFLQLDSGVLCTQPIKGTAARGHTTARDTVNKARLRTSEKEQAENVMIVDLSRNDLYRSCEVNTVEVPHLFEIQTFPQVHHLVSTVTGRKRKDIRPMQAFANTFPPGSMTGAPKFRTCELIDEYERSARGIYSGSLGYIAPGGDFDLNVVIRSLVYDAQSRRISYHVGGAITWDSDPEAEYQETLVKAAAIQKLFEGI